MIHPETRRYDFDYWPPVPLEQVPVLPAQSAEADELCHGVLYVNDSARQRALYTSGEWVDIQDFWLESKGPKPGQAGKDWEFPDMDSVIRPPERVRSRYHLSGPTYTFHVLCYEMVDRHLTETDPTYSYYPDFSNSELFKHLFHEVFSVWNKQYSHEKVLVSRKTVMDMYEGLDPVPWGLSKEGQALIAKVALRWSHGITQLEHFDDQT